MDQLYFEVALIPSSGAQESLRQRVVEAILYENNSCYALFAASHPTIAFFLEEPHRY